MDGISFDKAFERVFDVVCPDAGQLRTELNALHDRLIDAGPLPALRVDRPSDDELWDRWDAARREVDVFFRIELAHGALTAYQRHPIRGDEQVDPQYWAAPALIPGDADEFPPIFFLAAEFDAWLVRIDKNQKKEAVHKKKVGKRPLIKKYLAEKFPDGVPDPAHCPRQTLLRDLLIWKPILKPLDPATLKASIDEYNAEVGADPK